MREGGILIQYNLEPLPISSDAIAPDTGLNSDNLRSILCYLDYLTDTKIPITAGFDSKDLLNSHIGKSVFLTDKYIWCAVPSADLEFIFGSLNIDDYHAYLDPEYQFKHKICSNYTSEGAILSDIFYLNIKGDHFNPFIRWNSSSAASCRSCSKLLDLAGLEVVDIDNPVVHDNVFLDLVLTFPSIVDFYMFNPICRARAAHKVSKKGKVHKSLLEIQQVNFIDRMNRCNETFFKELDKLFYTPVANILGMSSNLHIWGSEVPVLPNCHFHNIIPFFSYTKNPKRDPNFFDNFNLFDLGLSDLEDYIAPIFAEVDVTPRNSNKRFEYGPGSSIPCCKTHIVTSDKQIVKKFVVDADKYKKLRLSLSNHLKGVVGFNQCPWVDPKYPIDVDKLKNLWSDIVYNEFQDIMDNWELLDVHIQWIPWYDKSKLLHALQYKSRPPVLDLDLFFKKCPGVVGYYDSVDPSKVIDYLNYQLEVAINCSNYGDITKYESLLHKAEYILDSFGPDGLLKWLQFLSVWSNDTRVFGFWRNIKRYLLDPEHELLVEVKVCPICNGVIEDTGIKTNSCVVDFVIIRSRSKFLVYNVKKGRPGLGGVLV